MRINGTVLHLGQILLKLLRELTGFTFFQKTIVTKAFDISFIHKKGILAITVYLVVEMARDIRQMEMDQNLRTERPC